jgi:2-iminobutanoate/2-iminopropanoate deaminase
MLKEVIPSDLAHPPTFGSPTSLGIRAGQHLYVSGMIAWDANRQIVGVGDIRRQTEQALENMRSVLAAEGAGFDRVVKITFYLTDIRDKQAVWEVRKRLFGDARPASTLVEVSHLVDPLALLEVDCVAYLGD